MTEVNETGNAVATRESKHQLRREFKDLRDLCEGSRVLIEVKIFQDWTFVVHVNTVGTTEEWRSRDDITVALYVRSTQCHVLLQDYTRPVTHYP